MGIVNTEYGCECMRGESSAFSRIRLEFDFGSLSSVFIRTDSKRVNLCGNQLTGVPASNVVARLLNKLQR